VVSAARDFVKSSFAQKLKIRFNQIVYILVGIAILLQFFSLEVRRGYSCLPHFIITTKPAYLYTHDGPRVSGSYFAGYYRLYQSNKIPCLISPLGLAHVIAAQIKQSSSDFVMIYAKQRENNHLISLGLYSVPLFLEMHGYKISYGKDTLILTGKLNRLIIKELDSKAYENFKESSIYPAILMKIPLVSRTDYDLRQKLTLLFRQLTALPKK
jgi:hypothetical protein